MESHFNRANALSYAVFLTHAMWPVLVVRTECTIKKLYSKGNTAVILISAWI